MAGTGGRTRPRGKKVEEDTQTRAKFIKDVNKYYMEERKRVGADKTGMYSNRASLEFSNKKGRKVPLKVAGVTVASGRALGEYRKPKFSGKEKVNKGREQARIRIFIPTLKEGKSSAAALKQAKKTIRHELAHHKLRRTHVDDPKKWHGGPFKTAKRTIDRKSREATNKNPKRTKKETRPMPKRPRAKGGGR